MSDIIAEALSIIIILLVILIAVCILCALIEICSRRKHRWHGVQNYFSKPRSDRRYKLCVFWGGAS